MRKIKLTKGQAKAIEDFKKHEKDLEFFANSRTGFIAEYAPIKDLTIDEMARALYVGYEVEPEYKPGDYVVNRHGTIGRIDRIEDNTYHGTWFNSAKEISMWCEKSIFKRHATQKEIEEAKKGVEEAKKIEWWKKHNKNVWELRRGDIIKPLTTKTDFDFCEVKRVIDDNVFLSKDTYVKLDDLKKYWAVVCFKEDRQDV